MFFDEDKVKSSFHVGQHGRQEDTKLAALRIINTFYPILGTSKLRAQFAAGEDSYSVVLKLKDSKGWNSRTQRFFSSVMGRAGLIQYVYPSDIPAKAGGLLSVWPRAHKDSQSYPRLNVPSDIRGTQDMQKLCEALQLRYLVLRERIDGQVGTYTFGLYHKIPLENWIGSNKSGHPNGKINRITFDCSFKYKFVGEGYKMLIEDLEKAFA
jgi:hypothetical protein